MLVQQLGGGHGVGFFDGVRGGEIVVFPGLDLDSGISVDHAAEILVQQGALGVYVAEEDAIHGVVEHQIQPFHGAHGGDLRHAEPGSVIGEADIAFLLFRHFVQSGAHDAEILLGGKGAAKTDRGGAVRHKVQQGLGGGADHGNDVRTLSGGCFGLHRVFVYVSGGDDHIDRGHAAGAVFGKEFVPLFPLAADAREHLGGKLIQHLVQLLGRGLRQFGQVKFPPSHSFSHFLRVQTTGQHGIGNRDGCPAQQGVLCLQVVNHHVRERFAVLQRSVDAHQTQHSALDRQR